MGHIHTYNDLLKLLLLVTLDHVTCHVVNESSKYLKNRKKIGKKRSFDLCRDGE
ncbi:hypothetical protein PIROE2DRAFT_15162 [Piromyces sp. E2]|nr:hypothetical protein PIROE2DRAFT_15162 [Piromyces sp. E2]|eukprot:OUM59336.1 hypothetical protein PIROE2DRAFT_15162 [Piromyces sp. E2]